MTNWRTFVAALAGALLVNVVPLLQGQWNTHDLVYGLALAIIGTVAKDYNVTGIGNKATNDVSKDTTIPSDKN